jgi:spore germination cell wall hydrolase CwlJ-like protein
MRKALKSILSAYAVVLAIIAVIVLLTASIVLLPSSNLPTIKFGESKDLNNFDAREVNCLALNIYHEARGSNLADKIAVADVVMNRTEDRRYPNTVCGVVGQGVKKGRADCQFSWKCDGKSNSPEESDSWIQAKDIAYNMYVHEKYRGITEGATHYHATYVKPYWAKSLQLVGRIGSHIYYRWE